MVANLTPVPRHDYRVGVPVSTTADLSSYSVGYEYDFLYFPRGFVGASLNARYTNINVDLRSPIGREFFEQVAPIPAYGFTGRGYPTKNLAVDFEMQFFNIPDSLAKTIEGDGAFRDTDIHATYNVTKNVGAQLGWHRTSIFYTTDKDGGDLKTKPIGTGSFKVNEFVVLEGSFHGRTYGGLSATAQPKFHEGFEPLLPGFTTVPFGDIDALICPVVVTTAFPHNQQGSLPERTITVDELLCADEVFSSGNYGKVMAVGRLQGRTLAPGPITRRARELYWAFAHR